MFKRINQFIEDVYAFMKRFEGASDAALMRKVLGSVDPDSTFKEPIGADRKEFIGRMETIYRDVVPILDSMIVDQLYLNHSENNDPHFGNGIVNGFDVVKQKFELWHGESLATKAIDNGGLIGGAIPIISASPFPGNTPGETERS